jgi:hypothetical protein
MDYEQFLASKRICSVSSGFSVDADRINQKLFDFQRDIVGWGLKKGKCAAFEDCGMGKTGQELEWSTHVVD